MTTRDDDVAHVCRTFHLRPKKLWPARRLCSSEGSWRVGLGVGAHRGDTMLSDNSFSGRNSNGTKVPTASATMVPLRM
jgi:hypothetical protein